MIKVDARLTKVGSLTETRTCQLVLKEDQQDPPTIRFRLDIVGFEIYDKLEMFREFSSLVKNGKHGIVMKPTRITPTTTNSVHRIKKRNHI